MNHPVYGKKKLTKIILKYIDVVMKHCTLSNTDGLEEACCIFITAFDGNGLS